MLPVDVLELTVGQRRILSLKGHWIPLTRVAGPGLMAELSCSGSSGAELFRELRHKTVCALRVDKEADVRGICEGVKHHLCQVILVLFTGEFAHCVHSSPSLGVLQLEQRVVGS